MKCFKDSKARTWDITVNVGTAKAVKDLTTVNLFDLYSTEAQKVFSDPCLLVNVLYVLCKKQAEDRKISDVEFGECLVGDSIEEAATSLLQEVAHFFPKSRREIMEKMLEKSQTAAKVMEKRAMEQVEALDVMSLIPSMK
jgi:hypothetical protein